jgi:hypothetical protein
MFYVRFNTHVTDHPRFADAGPQARDLWTWGMLYAGKHETDGELPMAAVLTSPWGYGGKANAKAAARLVAVGLWDRTDRGFRICRWSEQGNKTRAELEENREKERAKKAAARKKSDPPPACPPGTPQGTPPGTPEGVLNYISKGDQLTVSEEGESARGGVPAFFVAAAATAEMALGRKVDQLEARFVEYEGSRDRKRWGMSHKDAAAWLTTVMRAEGREPKTNTRVRGAEATKQPYDEDAPWLKLPEVG